MTQHEIIFNGIQRALPPSNAKNGSCQEIINMRFKKGCWRPIPEKVQYKPWNLSGYTKTYIHDIEGGIIPGEPNYIVLNYDGTTVQLFLLDADGLATQIGADIASDITPNIVFLKRTMIVTTGGGIKIFTWNDGSYAQIANLPVPDIGLSTTDSFQVNSEVESGGSYEKKAGEPDAIVGLYHQAINEQNQLNGRLYGSIMYICAYRLFDGSYILHSVPKYLEISNGGTLYRENTGNDGVDSSVFWWKFYVGKIQATINNELYPLSTIGSTKDLIDSVCIFATKATPLHKIDESSLTMSNLRAWFTSNVGSKSFSSVFPVSEDFKKMVESHGWYKVHEFLFEEVVGKNGRTTEEVDTVGFYQDYATRETLPVDQFTHHSLAARSAYVYNDRLHLLNIKTSLGKPYIYWPELEGYFKTGTVTGKINVFVKTGVGSGIVSSDITVNVYRESIEYTNNEQYNEVAAQTYIETELPLIPGIIADSAYYVFPTHYGFPFIVHYSVLAGGDNDKYIFPSIVGYNDSRAYRVQIIADNKLILDETLKKNSLMNFATWVNPSFAPTQSSNNNYSPVIRLVSDFAAFTSFSSPAEISLSFDTNRLQVSEIQNPLIFPAKNSYQVGTGDGITMAAGSEPLSTGQFGQFPLQVFTTKGIWALEIGTGDVLYINVLPVNKEVINNADNVVSIGSGVCYTTDKGLYIINGMNVAQLSEVVENDSELHNLSNVTEIAELTSNSKYVPSLSNSLSVIGFLEYLEQSTIGYDHINKELIVTNNNYSYSYLYSFESQLWYKISKSYKSLINAYPKLLGVTQSNVMSLSDESSDLFTDCMVITQPQSFEANEVYKKIERGILRCAISTGEGKYSGIYVIASNDLNTWQLITGKQRSGTLLHDLVIQRSHGSAKYYMIIFAGNIDTNSEVKQTNILITHKLQNKLR